MEANNGRIIKSLFVVGGIIFLILTVGFFFHLPWATLLWPWPDGGLTYIFIASITAAMAAPMVWIGLSGEFGAARGGASGLAVAATGIALYLFYLYSRQEDLQILIAAVVFALFVPANLLIFRWSRKIPIRDQREKPIMVEFSFVLFVIILVLVSSALIRHAPRVFPWPVKPESSVIFGLMFIGAIIYLLTALRVPKWHSARGQLLSFLVHDLVLIAPFLAHFSTVEPAHKTSLSIYTLIFAYSGILAVYFLFIDKTTRSWRIQDNPEPPISTDSRQQLTNNS